MSLIISGLFLKPPMRYCRHGNGHAVSVITQVGKGDGVRLVFEKKIERGDVVEGNLVQHAREVTKRRGGKRSTSLAISYEDSEALYAMLGRALRDERRRRYGRAFMMRMVMLIYRHHANRGEAPCR